MSVGRGLLSSLVSTVLLAVPVAAAQTPAAPVTVAFRCDDWRAFGTGDAFDAREAEVCARIVATFRAHGVPLTIGVTPDFERRWTLTPADSSASVLRALADDPLFEIALHGLTHERIAPASEWLGVPPEVQRERLETALGLMRDAVPGLRIRTFLPPWNSFDLATIDHLRANGFALLSGDTGIVRKRPFTAWARVERDYHGLAIVPCTTSMAELPAVLRRAAEDAPGTVVVVILHPYTFYPREGSARRGAPDPWDVLERALAAASGQAGVRCLKVGDLDRGALSADRYTAACRYHVVLGLLGRLLPARVLTGTRVRDREGGHWLANGRYLGEADYRVRERRAVAVLALVALLPALPATLAAGHLLRRRLALGFVTPVLVVAALAAALALEDAGQFLSAPTQGGLRAVTVVVGGVLYATLAVVLSQAPRRD